MKLRLALLLVIISVSAIAISVWGQADSVIGQFTNSTAESVAGGISGDGRFVVFESRGDIATENPRNADNNREIFLWDFAQRRIFQITNTKSVLNNHFGTPSALNTRVDIINKRPVISSDGRWIAFASNAYPVGTCAPGPTTTNPGNFDGNACTSPTPTPTPTPTGSPSPTPTPSATPTPNNNPLITDANLEIFLYQVPVAPPADLTTGEELPLTDLATGSFARVTDTPASRPPLPASSTSFAFVADDNHDVSISDNGEVLSFSSTRDLIAGSNTFPGNDNEEIFVYRQSLAALNSAAGPVGGTISQITITPRGSASSPIYNKNSAISGDGSNLVFASTGENPVPEVQPTPGPTASPVPSPPVPFPCGSNPPASRNEEVFYITLNEAGVPTHCRQITTTTPTNPGDPVNIFDLGKRISRDGRFVAFDSHADLANEHGGTNQPGFASFLFDADIVTPAVPFKRFLPRSDADSSAAGGDVPRFPSFTDYGPDDLPSTIVMETRLNIKPDGTIATTTTDGLNQDPLRPTQIYKTSAPLVATTPTPAFTRLTKFPISSTILAFTQPLPSDSSVRMAFDLPATELGTGNQDGQREVYYLYLPAVINPAPSPVLTFATGASRLAVTASPTPTPSPTATPTPTPTPSPSPTGSPLPTPTPVTPSAVLGLSPGMLAILNYAPATGQPTVARTAVGSLQRSFTLPIELSGVSLTINGVACGMKSVSQTEVVFVVPPFLSSATTGTSYPIVLNNNGTVYKSDITIVPARPDIFRSDLVPAPLGRAFAENVVNRVHTTEPFTVKTVQLRGGRVVPTTIRLRVTGIANTSAATISIRIGNVTIQGVNVLTGGVLVEPGVYTVDFQLPGALRGAGDQPIIVTVTAGGTSFSSRLDDTAPRISIL